MIAIPYVQPSGLGAPKASIQKFAEDVAKKLEFRFANNIESVVARLGGEIVVGSSGDGDQVSGSIIAKAIDDFTIFVSPLTSLKRDKFTIAHEIGHLLIHLNAIKKADPDAQMRATRWVDEDNPQQQRAEWEANWFAASFLMPTDDFTDTYNENGLEETSLIFGLSESTIKIRAGSLGL